MKRHFEADVPFYTQAHVRPCIGLARPKPFAALQLGCGERLRLLRSTIPC